MITGGAKFFNPSMCLSVNGASGVASNGSATAIYALDRNPFTYWYTVGSTDSSTETLTIDFGSIQTINRLFLIDHNFKQFTVKYSVAGVWTDFTSVVGMDGALAGGISETVFADSTAYYEFASVSCQQIQVSISKTQVANKDKYLAQCVATSEIGTFAGYPTIKSFSTSRNAKVNPTISGKTSVIKGDESVQFTLSFKSYPSSTVYNVDIDLVMTLQDMDGPFLVWLCGGRRGSNYFNYTLRGYRLKDLYLMAITKEIPLTYTQNITKNSLNAELQLEESV